MLYYVRLATGTGDQEEAVEDHEQIHQIRVWSRRSVAALRVFSPVLDIGPAKRWRKLLVRTRRATGLIRDLDVLIVRLLASESGAAGLTPVLEGRRTEAREELRRTWQSDNPESILTRLLEDLSAHIHPPAHVEPFSLWAPARLATVYHRFGRSWPQPGDDAKAHHRFRIRGKDLRYALELLGAPFATEIVAATYAEIETLQDRLGEMNDLSTASVILGELVTDRSEELVIEARRQLDADSRTAAELLRDFHGEWSLIRRRGLESSFETLLGERSD